MKWFNKQSRLVQFLLLIIPFVNWVTELVIRWTAWAAHKDIGHLIVAIIFTVIGWSWILGVIDLIYCMITGHLIYAK